MKRLVVAVLAVASLLGATSMAAPAFAASRPVVAYEPTMPPHYTSVVRPTSWYLTKGPATQLRHARWSHWGSSTATGTATLYVIDFGTHNEGRATLKLYDVKTHDGTRYFSKLLVSGAKAENGIWSWIFMAGEWS
jgi:hypothetical protein